MHKHILLSILLLMTAMPAFAAVEPRLAGNWSTTDSDGNSVTLHLEASGRYTKTSAGQVVEQGTMTAIDRTWSSQTDSGTKESGTFSIIANQLVLRSSSNPTLRFKKGTASNVTVKAPATNPPVVKNTQPQTKPTSWPNTNSTSLPPSTPITKASTTNPLAGNVAVNNPLAKPSNSQVAAVAPQTSTAVQSSGYKRFPTGFQGMPPNKGFPVGQATGFPNQPISPNLLKGGFKSSISNLINTAKTYGIKKAINQATATQVNPAAAPPRSDVVSTSTNQAQTNTTNTNSANDIGEPVRNPKSLAKGPVAWDYGGNWSMVDENGKPFMLHILHDGRYYMTQGGFHIEAGSMKAANGKYSLQSLKGRKDSGTISATENGLVINSSSAGTTKWTRIGKKMPEPMKQAKSKYRPKRSGFSRTYGGYTEYYGGGRMKRFDKFGW